MLAVAVAGLVLLGVSVAGARGATLPAAEQRVFRAVNGLPDALYRVLWLPMQLGNLVVGTLAGVVAVAPRRDLWMVAAVVLAALLKLGTERVLRARLGPSLAARRRPGTSEPGAILRGDVPADGPSFPSGHVILVAAVGGVVGAAYGMDIASIVGVLALVVAFGRVYVGAHNPLDVTAGLGLGLAIGGALGALL